MGFAKKKTKNYRRYGHQSGIFPRNRGTLVKGVRGRNDEGFEVETRANMGDRR